MEKTANKSQIQYQRGTIVSSPAASPRVSRRAAEARYQSWRKLENGHKHFFIHTRAVRAIERLLFKVEGNCNGLSPDVNLFDKGILNRIC